MTHFDDGQLHAYLDGELANERAELEQHLAQCGECRARLEAARSLRQRARDVLHAAGPANTTAPPFEQVVRRAQGQGQGHRMRTPTHIILAWAASLAVAVTAGWYARGLLPTGHVAPAAMELARAPSVEARPPAQAAEARPPRQIAQARGTGAARRAPVTATVDTQPPSGNAVAAAAPQSGAAGAVGEQADLASARGAAEKGLAAPAPAAPTAANARSAAPSAQLQEVVVTAKAAAPALKEAVVTGTAAALEWTTISRPAAEERLGGRIGTIPGLALLGHAVSGTGASTVVRTIQVLRAGTTIELYQRHAGVRLDSTGKGAAPGAGTTSLTVSWQGYSVTGTAPVPADSLQKLLAQLSAP